MVSRRAVLSGLVALGCAPSTWAAPSDGEPSPDSIIRKAIDRGQVPGVVALIGDRRGVVRADVAGFSDIEARQPMRRDTLFRVASMTKPITAVAALMLVDEGTLDLDAPVEKWLPELADRRVLRDPRGPLSDTEPARRSLTARDLLTFRAGYAHWAFLRPGSPLAKAMEAAGVGSNTTLNLDITPDEFMRRLATLPLAYHPGEVWQYQTPSEILGVLVGRASRRPFEDFLADRIFAPLGMADTAFFVPETKLSRFSSAYLPGPGGLLRIDEPATSPWRKSPVFASGAGGLVSTADDYARFARMLLNEGSSGRARILRPQTVRLMGTNALTREQRRLRPPLNPAIPQGQHGFDRRGFGMSVAVTLEAGAHEPAPGAYGWDGLFGTEWTNDPANGLAKVFMMQVMGGHYGLPLAEDYVRAAYRSLGR